MTARKELVWNFGLIEEVFRQRPHFGSIEAPPVPGAPGAIQFWSSGAQKTHFVWYQSSAPTGLNPVHPAGRRFPSSSMGPGVCWRTFEGRGAEACGQERTIGRWH